MAQKKHLDGTGKGAFSYDYKYDILTFKTEGRNYKKSLEFQNFVIDIDDEDFITGIRIFDASEVFGVDKIKLRHLIGFEFKSNVENNVVTITFKFAFKVRNILFIPLEEKFTQQLTERAPIAMADSSVGPIAA